MPNEAGVKKFFAAHWEKIVFWAILIGIFYSLRPFFFLILATFLITYMTKSIVDWIVSRLQWNYRLVTTIVFVLFVFLLGTIAGWIGPKIVVQSNLVISQFAGNGDEERQEKIDVFVETLVTKIMGEEKAQGFLVSKEYASMLGAVKIEAAAAFKTALPHVLETMVKVMKVGWGIFVALLLAIVFSFILVGDWKKIAKGVKKLQYSRIATFYNGAAPHLQAFVTVLGKALRAQAIIATCNTILTALGLWYFDIPNIALLSTIVFFCGFIPILGTFMSSIPILLFAVQAGGLLLVFKLIILIAIVHAIEAYILNPKITANVLEMHPILVLVFILLGERFFGIWGMVLGVPVGYYLITVLMKPVPDAETEAENRIVVPGARL